MKWLLFCLTAIVSLLVSSCNGKEQGKSDGVNTDSEENILPLPEVPATLATPQDRADYIMTRFWDKMVFSDTLRSHDKDFMEMNLVNFMSLFPHGSEQATSQSIGRLLTDVAKDSVSFRLVTDVLERYLDDPNSPMRNESHYILYLEELLRLPGLSEYDRMRPAYRLEIAKKNRPGSIATDFVYTDRNGRPRTLHKTKGEKLLLLFYDPECEHCSEILRQVHESNIIKNSIDTKKLTILAVYTEENRKAWDETKNSMPQEWTIGIDIDSIEENELYSIPAMPVMYLLDRDKKVLLKDAFLPEIEALLNLRLEQ